MIIRGQARPLHELCDGTSEASFGVWDPSCAGRGSGGLPLRADDVHWAFFSFELVDPETDETLDLILTPSRDETTLTHCGAADRVRFRVYRRGSHCRGKEPSSWWWPVRGGLRREQIRVFRMPTNGSH